MPRLHPEQDFQTQVALFLTWALPSDVFWTAIGHGGGGRARGAILKRTGVKPGIPDLQLIYKKRHIWIELKTRGVYLSAAQKEVHTALVLQGDVVTVIRTMEELVNFLEVLGIPLQARLTPAERAVQRATALRAM